MPIIKDVCPACGQEMRFGDSLELHWHAAHPDVPVHRCGPKARWADAFKPGSFEAIFAAIFQRAFELLVQRQRKYGPDNVRKLGLFGLFGRLGDDKMARLKRSFNGRIVNGEVVLEPIQDGKFGDESWTDTVLDAINYPAIMLSVKEGTWGLPLNDELPNEMAPAPEPIIPTVEIACDCGDPCCTD